MNNKNTLLLILSILSFILVIASVSASGWTNNRDTGGAGTGLTVVGNVTFNQTYYVTTINQTNNITTYVTNNTYYNITNNITNNITTTYNITNNITNTIGMNYTNIALTNESEDWGSNNLTTNGWFNGKFNWTALVNWLHFDGVLLTFNETHFNKSVIATGLDAGFNSTYNSSYATALNNGSYLSTYNASYVTYGNQSMYNSSYYLNSNPNGYYNSSNFQSYNASYVPYTGANGSVYLGTYNLTATNLNATGYIDGQPLTGSLGSGIIWANGTNSFAEVVVQCTGLSCGYSAFKVRLVNSTNIVKYCDIPNATRTVTDNQHSVLYIDNNCAVQETNIQTYINTPVSPGGIADFANVVAVNGNTYNQNGIGLENKRIIKLRKILLQSTGKHLSIIDGGFNLQQNPNFRFNITASQYVYLMDIVSTTAKNTTTDNNEIVYHTGAATWGESDQKALNVTTCDTGSGIADCTNPTKYRRAFIFMIGYNESIDETQIHQLLPLQSISYNTIADCLNINSNPITYSIPAFYQYAAVPLYAYCAKATDTTWSAGQTIDLRGSSGGTASSGITDISTLVPYTGATTQVNLGIYNMTTGGWFNGKYNWTALANWLSFDGSTLIFNETKANNTFVNVDGDTMTGSLNMGYNNLTNINRLKFNITNCVDMDTTEEGTVCWNSDKKTINVVTGLGNVLQLTQETSEICKNKAGQKIYAGQVVSVSNASGDMPHCYLANANTTNTNIHNLAMVTIPSCNDNAACVVTTWGEVHDLNTNAYANGTELFLSSDGSGNVTNVAPNFPNYNLHIGTVLRAHPTTGIVLFKRELDIDDGVTMNSLGVINNVTTTGWFNGKYNWTALANWLHFDGSILTFNETYFNQSVLTLGNAAGWNSTYNLTYDTHYQNTTLHNDSTYNATYAGTTTNWEGNFTAYMKFWVNHTLYAIQYFETQIGLNQSTWSSTYNVTYADTTRSLNANYSTFIATYNQTYDNFVSAPNNKSLIDWANITSKPVIPALNNGSLLASSNITINSAINMNGYNLSNNNFITYQNSTGSNVWRTYVNASGFLITESGG